MINNAGLPSVLRLVSCAGISLPTQLPNRLRLRSGHRSVPHGAARRDCYPELWCNRSTRAAVLILSVRWECNCCLTIHRENAPQHVFVCFGTSTWHSINRYANWLSPVTGSANPGSPFCPSSKTQISEGTSARNSSVCNSAGSMWVSNHLATRISRRFCFDLSISFHFALF